MHMLVQRAVEAGAGMDEDGCHGSFCLGVEQVVGEPVRCRGKGGRVRAGLGIGRLRHSIA